VDVLLTYHQLQCCSQMLTLIFAGEHSIRKSVDVSFPGACCLILLRKRMNSTHSICRSLSGNVCSEFCLSSVSIKIYIIIVGNVCSEFCLSSVFSPLIYNYIIIVGCDVNGLVEWLFLGTILVF